MTNLNITSNDHKFMYVVDYIRNTSDSVHEFEYIYLNGEVLFKTELSRHENIWSLYNKNNDHEKITAYASTIRLYFPQFSVETYNDRIKYALDVTMYVSNKKIILGSFLIDRFNSLAAPKIVKFQGQEYYECIDLNIVDPYDVLYSDDFQSFRGILKDSKEFEDNADATSLYISLHPVEGDEELYIMDNNYNGSQNSIMISDGVGDFLNYNIKFNYNDNILESKLDFNSVYNGNLQQYLLETYKLDGEVKIKYLLGINKISPSIIEKESTETTQTYTTADIKNNMKCLVPSNNSSRYVLKKLFDDWGLWEEGISFKSTAIISVGGEDKLVLHSNQIPITQELYSKIKIDTQVKINLDDMEVKNINVINEIKSDTQIYQVTENSKSSIILPVFYRVRDLGNIVIHPEVNENICINLDAYKSKVDTFIMQIEGVKFNEIGTTNSGTIFKVVGNMLPQNLTSGTYYILSQDGDLVVTGKYTYEY